MREKILQQLRQIIDPVTHVNIVDANLISHINIDNEFNVRFALEIEESTLKKRQLLVPLCKEALLKNIPDIKQVVIALTNKPNIADKTIVVASGKGGVGKSTIALNLAICIAQQGYSVAIVDADIYGPSIPHMLQVHDKPEVRNGKFIPISKYGIKSMSIGYLVPTDSAVVWRGPMITKSLQQIFLRTEWGKLDYMIIDTPPGTGDVHITLSKLCKISTALIVTTPHALAVADAIKACDMFEKLNINICGLVENMSYFIGHDNKIEYLFGSSDAIVPILQRFSIKCVGKVPMHQSLFTLDKPPVLDTYMNKYFVEIVQNIL